MNLLLDTHILIWAFSNNSRLTGKARDALVDGHNQVFVSAVTAWEITIKKALGKLKVPDSYEDELTAHRFTALDVTTAHALAVGRLPPHHADPFDRLLIAQTRVENLKLITADPMIQRYDIPIIAA